MKNGGNMENWNKLKEILAQVLRIDLKHLRQDFF